MVLEKERKMNKQELIEKIDNLQYSLSWNIPLINKEIVIDLIEQLDEPQKPVVKQVVADWYEKNKNNLDKNIYDCIVGWGIHSKEIRDWMRETSPFQTLVNMHQFGYEVAKEKRYIVKVKGAEEGYNYLNCRISLNEYFFSGESEPLDFRVKHTREMLEKAGFGWVFDCEGIEVKEVKE